MRTRANTDQGAMPAKDIPHSKRDSGLHFEEQPGSLIPQT
jgi:hypothetical protein